jgi:hypothetical protein
MHHDSLIKKEIIFSFIDIIDRSGISVADPQRKPRYVRLDSSGVYLTPADFISSALLQTLTGETACGMAAQLQGSCRCIFGYLGSMAVHVI